MSSANETPAPAPERFGRTFALRIALWYATLFVLGSIAIIFLTYYLTSASLVQRDRQIINAKLGEYAWHNPDAFAELI